MSKVGRLPLLLFYLLVLLLPTQLGQHFFGDFTTISGIRSDYLTPTIYLTDIIAIILIVVSLRGAQRRSNPAKWDSSTSGSRLSFFQNEKLFIAFIITGYLLFNVIFIATNHWAAFYKFIKILEFILLSVTISRLKPKLITTSYIFSISVVYSSIIAIWQFLIQKSVGGLFWWLGERTFYASTPGVAAFAYKGSLLLRPYGTFPHPNVLGGFLSVVLPFIFFNLYKNWKRHTLLFKGLFVFTIIIGLTCLILTFSRTAWLVTGIGFVLFIIERFRSFRKIIEIPKKYMVLKFYLLIFFSIFIPVFLPHAFLTQNQYWQERVILLKAAIAMIGQNLVFGVGLNNSIVHLKDYINYIPGIFIFQPIHNIFLLVLSEIGIAGVGIILWGGLKIFSTTAKNRAIFFVTLIQLFFLGLFDHYLYTLQQGQLLLTIFVALSRI